MAQTLDHKPHVHTEEKIPDHILSQLKNHQNGLGAIRIYILSVLGQKITFDLRNQVYTHLHRHSLSYYNQHETGTIMASITQDVGRLQDFISDGLQEIIRDFDGNRYEIKDYRKIDPESRSFVDALI